ncbi:hypothetical protein [Paraburkholderia sp.]|uniref:hypothetical protein n=1 Tax=Paraburkholderia sp. TaxID=1926495 RepID=UPI003D6F70A9
MDLRASARACFSTSIVAFSGSAYAHAFAAPYALPVPLRLYTYGTTAALIISFIGFVAFASNTRTVDTRNQISDESRQLTIRTKLGRYRSLFRFINAFILLTVILGGILGTQNAMLNFDMTWFWMIFYLAAYYAAALIGDFYSYGNPWLGCCDFIEKLTKISFNGRRVYPNQFGCWPALACYICLISMELFGSANPRQLSEFLIIYTLISIVGAWWFGKLAWFKFCDLFSILFHLAGLIAPINVFFSKRNEMKLSFRIPTSGLRDMSDWGPSLMVFVLFMLSSTAFDGIHDTIWWNRVYWGGFYPLIEPSVKAHFTDAYAVSSTIYRVSQWILLVISPAIYLIAYLAALDFGRRLIKTSISLKQLASDFSLTLVPIAFFYSVTHYYTVLFSQGPQIILLISDPLGLHWNIFGTANFSVTSPVIDAGTIWLSQVALILIGHIASVYLAHVKSLQVFSNRHEAVLSQIPMVGLMIFLTASGLWILSLPLA